MKHNTISLYDCFHARWTKGNEILCDAGHLLPHVTKLEVARGAKLCPRVCQYCQNYLTEGEPVNDNEKGWLKK